MAGASLARGVASNGGANRRRSYVPLGMDDVDVGPTDVNFRRSVHDLMLALNE
jgi:hypothetical protein